jgi:hypothetical protein
MRLYGSATTLGGVVLVVAAWACGARPREDSYGVGTVGGGGGTEILDGGRYGSGSGASSGNSAGESGASSGGSGMGVGESGGVSGSGASSGASGSSGASAGSGATGGSGASGSSGAVSEIADAGDGSTGGLHLTIGGPVHLVSLHWTISGPNTYDGSVEFGDAQSVEWVVGGIAAGSGYTLSVTATDSFGDPCDGTSSTFSVDPGIVNYTLLTITCHSSIDGESADVTTGSVAIEAGVVLSD